MRATAELCRARACLCAYVSSMGGGQNFERANVERPIFRNKKIASVECYERSSYSIFSITKFFFHFSKIIWSLKFWLFFFLILTLQFFTIFQI